MLGYKKTDMYYIGNKKKIMYEIKTCCNNSYLEVQKTYLDKNDNEVIGQWVGNYISMKDCVKKAKEDFKINFNANRSIFMISCNCWSDIPVYMRNMTKEELDEE